jgi:hypothetical protein
MSSNLNAIMLSFIMLWMTLGWCFILYSIQQGLHLYMICYVHNRFRKQLIQDFFYISSLFAGATVVPVWVNDVLKRLQLQTNQSNIGSQ